jgi:RNA polymerase sigma-70 factor, ECF subfamily
VGFVVIKTHSNGHLSTGVASESFTSVAVLAKAAPSELIDRKAAHARLRSIFEAEYDFVWRLLRRMGVPVDRVDDASQETFVVVSRRLADIRTGAEKAFLFGTCLRVAADVRRASARAGKIQGSDADGGTASAQVTAEDMHDPAPDAAELLDQKRARAHLDRILAAMTVDLRAVFVLHELEGMTMEQIAKCVGVPLGTVASRLRRAREHFDGEIARLTIARASHESGGQQ